MPTAMFAPSRPIYRVAGIRDIEAQALPGAVPPLMERAGAAAAALALRLLFDRPGAALVACGPGPADGTVGEASTSTLRASNWRTARVISRKIS